jgi:hypothetical protein
VVALLVCAALSTLPGAAPGSPEARISWKVDHSLGGAHRPHGLVPLAVEVSNGSDRDAVVLLEGETSGPLVRREVELPAGTRKELTFYLGPVGFGRSHKVRLLEEGGRVLGEDFVTSLPVDRDELLVGIVGSHLMGWGSLKGEEGLTVRTVSLRAERIPSRAEGIRALDVMVWADPLTSSLRPDQVRAVARWTEGGGRLILAMNDVWLESSTGAHEPWTHARAAGIVSVKELPSLGSRAGEGFGPLREPITAARLTPGRGSVWLRERWGALGVIERRGLGVVAVLGFDPTERPLAGWTGLGTFWRRLLRRMGVVEPESEDAHAPYYSQALDLRLQARQILSWVEGVEPPAFRYLLVVLMIYLLAIGPFDYLLLRRKGKLAWTWLTYPLLVALFTLGTYAVAAASRSGEAHARHILQRDLLAESDSFAEELHAALFVDDAGELELRARPPGGLPLLPASMGQGGPGPIAPPWAPWALHQPVVLQERSAVSAHVPKWALLAGTFLRHVPAEGARIDAVLQHDGRALRGSIVSRLGQDLTAAWVLFSHEGALRRVAVGPLHDGVPTTLVPDAGMPIGRRRIQDRRPPKDAKPESYVEDLILQSVRRLARGAEPEEESWRERQAWWQLMRDPHPDHDWSGLVERGGAVLVGWAPDPERRTEVEGLSLHGEGIVVYRVPLPPEVITR